MDISDEVRLIIAKALKISPEQLTAQSRLDELGAESLDIIEIVYSLEEKFDISIPFNANEAASAKPGEGEAAEAQFSTVGDIASLVKKLVEKKAAP